MQQNLEKIKLLSVEFDNQPVYDEEYIKTSIKHLKINLLQNLQTMKF